LLHELGLCHRDLKLENFLFAKPLTNDSQEEVVIKLIDFGFSKKFGQSSSKMHALVGTPYYIAPEVIKGDYDMKCDVWSCGIILHLLLTGFAPFAGADTEQTLERIQKMKIDFKNSDFYVSSQISEQARDLLSLMLEKDPAKRPSIKEC
jgi:calcium-dependent protein kinase